MKVTSRIESTDWIFYGVNKEKVLTLSRDKRITDWTSLTVDYLKYDSFEKTYGEFITMFDAVKSTFSISKIQRLGLRYVNNIYLNEKNPLNWNKYINSHLLCGLRFAEDKNLVTRIFHNLEIKYDDMNVRFQYGIRNPDYPSIIKKKEFILDYDVYWSGEQDISELSGKLKKYHDHILRDTEKVRLRNGINLRDLHPDIDPLHLGNATFTSMTEFTRKEIHAMSIAQIANRLKETIAGYRNEKFAKALSYLTEYGIEYLSLIHISEPTRPY